VAPLAAAVTVGQRTSLRDGVIAGRRRRRRRRPVSMAAVGGGRRRRAAAISFPGLHREERFCASARRC